MHPLLPPNPFQESVGPTKQPYLYSGFRIQNNGPLPPSSSSLGIPQMTATIATEQKIADPKKNRRVCFSFAAYSKAVIGHLRSSFRVPVTAGLSDLEFTAIETSYGFSFPPDLRSILSEGLPIGSGFPNWRSSSSQQLKILLSLPIATILNEVSKGNFWCEAWGPRPGDVTDCLKRARGVLDSAPKLVPIYRYFYIVSGSNMNGNPVFYIRGGEVRCWGLDISDFFRRFQPDDRDPTEESGLPVPAWAAKSARRVEVWSDLAGEKRERRDTWQEVRWREIGWRLRDGGWREEEVREMLSMDGQDDDKSASAPSDRMVLRDREGVMWHVRLLALALLRAGWSNEDVVYAMGSSKSKFDTWLTSENAGGNEISIDLY